MSGTDEPWRTGLVIERSANFRHEIRDVGFRNEGVGPETLLDLGLRDDIRPFIEQEGQQLERLWLKMDLGAIAQELARPVVQYEPSEFETHELGPSRRRCP